MAKGLSDKNKSYWQRYKPGEIPSVPVSPPLSLLEEIKGPILDVGTGEGKLAEELASQNKRVYGIDIAENIIEENKKRDSEVGYSIQDITTKTNFPDNYFDLIIFKFVLTNIHRESWKGLNKETTRILKPEGKVWILEPLVSESYNQRYELASNFIKGDHCVYVFKDKDMAVRINSIEEMKAAIDNDQVSRIIKHYTVDELRMIFDKLKLESSREIVVTSPSGYTINTFEGVWQK